MLHRASRLACRGAQKTAAIKAQRTYKTVAATEAIEALAKGEGQFVDVRAPDQDIFLEGFVSIPHAVAKEQLAKFSREAPIYLIDTAGYHSARVAAQLESHGFSRVNVIQGGLLMWQFHGGAPRFRDPQKQQRADFLLAQQTGNPSEATARQVAADFGLPEVVVPNYLELSPSGEVVVSKAFQK